MTNQGDRQADARSSTGTSLTYEGDTLAYFDSQSVPAGDYNGRLLAWINQTLGTSYTEINGAKTALANNVSIPTWDGLNLLGSAGAPQIRLSNATIPDTTASGSTVGILSVSGATGTPTFTLSSNPGALFSITGTALKTAAILSAGSYPITVHVTGMTPSPPDRAVVIFVTHASSFVPTYELLGF